MGTFELFLLPLLLHNLIEPLIGLNIVLFIQHPIHRHLLPLLNQSLVVTFLPHYINGLVAEIQRILNIDSEVVLPTGILQNIVFLLIGWRHARLDGRVYVDDINVNSQSQWNDLQQESLCIPAHLHHDISDVSLQVLRARLFLDDGRQFKFEPAQRFVFVLLDKILRQAADEVD